MRLSGLRPWFSWALILVGSVGCASSGSSLRSVQTAAVDLEGLERIERDTYGVLFAKPDVLWSAFGTVSIAPIVFDLADERQVSYDLRARRRRRIGVSDSDRELLRSQLLKRVRRVVEEWGDDTDDTVSGEPESLTIIPIVQRVEWSRPPVGERTLPLGVDGRSIGAGGATVAFELRRNGQDGELVAFAQESWNGNLGDQRPRVGIWSDAIEAFRIITRRFADDLQELGVGGARRG